MQNTKAGVLIWGSRGERTCWASRVAHSAEVMTSPQYSVTNCPGISASSHFSPKPFHGVLKVALPYHHTAGGSVRCH